MLALTPRQQSCLVGLAVFGAVLSVYVASLAAVQLNTDAIANSFSAWHYAHGGGVFFDGDRLPSMKGGLDYWGPNAAGHIVVSRTPGQIWLAVPFYFFFSNGQFAQFSYTQGSLAAAFWSALAVVLFYVGLRSRLSMRGAVFATGVLAFATPVWSVAAETLWPHCLTLLGISGAIWSVSRGRWALAGAFLGVGILARPHVAVIAAVLGIGLSCSRRSLRPGVMVALGSGAFLTLLLVWNRLVFGGWTLAGGYTQGLADVVPGHRDSRLGDGYLVQLGGLLVSPNRGFFVWTPLVLLLLPLVWKGRRALPDWSLWLALGGVTYTAVQAALNEWTGGSGFNGYRLSLELLMCLAPCLSLVAVGAGKNLVQLIPLAVGYQLAVIAVAVVSPGTLQEPDFWTDNTILQALRDTPVLTIGLLLAAGLAGWASTRWALRGQSDRGTPRSSTAVPADQAVVPD